MAAMCGVDGRAFATLPTCIEPIDALLSRLCAVVAQPSASPIAASDALVCLHRLALARPDVMRYLLDARFDVHSWRLASVEPLSSSESDDDDDDNDNDNNNHHNSNNNNNDHDDNDTDDNDDDMDISVEERSPKRRKMVDDDELSKNINPLDLLSRAVFGSRQLRQRSFVIGAAERLFRDVTSKNNNSLCFVFLNVVVVVVVVDCVVCRQLWLAHCARN
jgi:hypothetical protein